MTPGALTVIDKRESHALSWGVMVADSWHFPGRYHEDSLILPTTRPNVSSVIQEILGFL
jgi:hypothetical protein